MPWTVSFTMRKGEQGCAQTSNTLRDGLSSSMRSRRASIASSEERKEAGCCCTCSGCSFIWSNLSVWYPHKQLLWLTSTSRNGRFIWLGGHTTVNRLGRACFLLGGDGHALLMRYD